MAASKLQRLFGRSRFKRDQRGAVAIEFAFLAIPFFLIIGAILETALMFLCSQIFDSAVQDASRLIRTGQANAAQFTVSSFRDQVCDGTYGLFGDCSGIFIDVETIDKFSVAVIEPPIDRDCTENCRWTRESVYSPGGASEKLLVQAYYKWPTTLDFFGFSVANLADGTRLMSSAAVFRNEPF